MNKSVKKSNKSPSTAILLRELNRIYKRYDQATTKIHLAMNNEDTRAVSKYGDEASRALAKFNAIKSQLPPLKFDQVLGQYFLARNSAGKEMFHIRCDIVHTVYFDLPAKNEKDALAEAWHLAKEGKTNGGCVKITPTNVSSPVR